MVSYTVDPVETVNRMLDNFFQDRSYHKRHDSSSDRYPPVDMFTGKDAVLIRAEIPGVKSENIQLTVKEDLLSIEIKMESGVPEGFRTITKERPFGESLRKIKLPYRVEAGEVQAKLSNGVLELRLPRAESDKPVTIKVNG